METKATEATESTIETRATRRHRHQGRLWRPRKRRNGALVESPIWWIQYYSHGNQIRESSGTTDEKKAARLLSRKLAEVRLGVYREPVRLTYGALRDAYLADYVANERKSLRFTVDKAGIRCPVLYTVERLNEFFDDADQADRITTARMREFRRTQREKGRSHSTVNRSLSALRAMFHLAKEESRLRDVDVPHVPMVKEPKARKGFFERSEYLALLAALPDYVRVPFALAYFTGMRKGEILGLRWDEVAFLGGVVRLADSKNGEPRTVPLGPELRAMLEGRHAQAPADCPWVCFRIEKGNAATGLRRVGDFRKVWESSCAAAGLDGKKLFHDLRRSGVRNLIRAGVSQHVAKQISGHKTDSVFNRYNITSDRDILDAAEKLAAHLAEQDKVIAESSGHRSGHPSESGAMENPLVN